MEITLERFVQAAAAVLEIEPQQLVPAIKIPLAESALAAPFANFGGEDFYPDPIERSAILASRIMRNHPLPDGNKRVALISWTSTGCSTAGRR
jgi:death on curing protein